MFPAERRVYVQITAADIGGLLHDLRHRRSTFLAVLLRQIGRDLPIRCSRHRLLLLLRQLFLV